MHEPRRWELQRKLQVQVQVKEQKGQKEKEKETTQPSQQTTV
jgi:hypothetical protein